MKYGNTDVVTNHLCCCGEYCTVISTIHFVHKICTFLLHILDLLFTDKVLQYCKSIAMKLHSTNKLT